MRRSLVVLVALLLAYAVFSASPASAQVIQGPINCVYCSYCPLDSHTAYPWAYGEFKHMHECIPNCCAGLCDGHPSCLLANADQQEREEIFDALLASAYQGELAAAYELAEEFSDRVTLHLDRRALQIQGNNECDSGQLVGHIPLTTGQVAAFVARQPAVKLVRTSMTRT
jgi:hypothetical protein